MISVGMPNDQGQLIRAERPGIDDLAVERRDHRGIVAVLPQLLDQALLRRDAVLRDGKGDYIFRVTGSKAERVPVKIGIETDQYTEIIGSIDRKSPIITVGNYELQDGMAVREGGPK